jgi:capsular exopolysaccharide synthesis family protein
VVLRRRRKIIYAWVITLGLLAALYCVFATRRYEATGLVEVQSKNQDQLGVESLTGQAAGSEPDALTANLNIQTQANILESDSLALKTISDLNLESTSDYKGGWNPISWLMSAFSAPDPADRPGTSLEDSPGRRRRALLVFRRLFKVKAQSGTRLIEVSYLSSDPQVAAAVVNHMMLGLTGISDETRRLANEQVAKAVGDQLDALGRRSEELQKQLADQETKSGVLNLGTTDAAGNAVAYSSVVEQLKEVSAQLAVAEQNRILRQAVASAAENGDSEALSSLAGNTSIGTTTINSLGLIQLLHSQEAAAEAALSQAEAKFGSGYQKLDELRANLSAIQRALQKEVVRLRERAKNDYKIAEKTENDTRAEYDRLRAKAASLNDSNLNLNLLRQRADAASKLYQDMENKLQQAGVVQTLKGSVITIIDPGRAPGKPAKPNVPLYLAIAIVAGFLLGLVAALVADVMDNKLHALSDVEAFTPEVLTGVTPELDKKIAKDGPALTAIIEPGSSFAGAVRALRSNLLLKLGEGTGKVIEVTSGVSGEGKTTISANLAALLAQSGKKVLLADADLRSGALRSLFNIKEGTGLSEWLKGQTEVPPIAGTQIAGLSVLAAGSAPDAIERLGSESFRQQIAHWRQHYDYIVFDSGPMMPEADSLALAPVSDVIVQVVRPGVSEKNQIARTHAMLASSTSHPIAVVVNGLHREEDGYSSFFGSAKPEQK